jgi:hypothetical protein
MYEKTHQYPKVHKWTQIWLLPDQVLDPARLPFQHNCTEKSCSTFHVARETENIGLCAGTMNNEKYSYNCMYNLTWVLLYIMCNKILC